MLVQLLVHLFVEFLTGSFPFVSGHSSPGLLDRRSNANTIRSGINRYYHSREAADYEHARQICFQKFGNGYGLAVLKTEDDMKALRAFLYKNVAPKTELWIGGSYYEGGKQFVWMEVKREDGKPLPLPQFAIKLIHGYPSTYNHNDRIVFYMKDQYTPLLKTEVYTSMRTFICEYREDRDE